VKALVERDAARGLRAVGITGHGDGAEEKAQVAKVATEHGVTWPTLLDVSGAWQKAAGIHMEPTFLLLDRTGKVAYRHSGKLTVESDAFAKMAVIIEKM
jgi:Redoxin